jgi:hypothetical protein
MSLHGTNGTAMSMAQYRATPGLACNKPAHLPQLALPIQDICLLLSHTLASSLSTPARWVWDLMPAGSESQAHPPRSNAPQLTKPSTRKTASNVSLLGMSQIERTLAFARENKLLLLNASIAKLHSSDTLLLAAPNSTAQSVNCNKQALSQQCITCGWCDRPCVPKQEPRRPIPRDPCPHGTARSTLRSNQVSISSWIVVHEGSEATKAKEGEGQHAQNSLWVFKQLPHQQFKNIGHPLLFNSRATADNRQCHVQLLAKSFGNPCNTVTKASDIDEHQGLSRESLPSGTRNTTYGGLHEKNSASATQQSTYVASSLNGGLSFLHQLPQQCRQAMESLADSSATCTGKGLPQTRHLSYCTLARAQGDLLSASWASSQSDQALRTSRYRSFSASTSRMSSRSFASRRVLQRPTRALESICPAHLGQRERGR